jgi:DNA-binding FadR family transcriptional regulator
MSHATTSVLEPVRLRRAGEHVADLLVTAIALGEFVPGQRLPAEREAAEMLGVSRTTVRDALQRLARLGYVQIRRGRHGGAYVLTDSRPGADEMIGRALLREWDAFERLFDFRQLIEPLIARTAAERRRRSDVTRIRRALRDYVVAGDDREASRAADQELHAAIAAATHNPYLVNVSADVRREISLGFGAEPYSRDIRAQAVRDHSGLVDAVVVGDADTAAGQAAHHFRLTERVLRELRARIASGPAR